MSLRGILGAAWPPKVERWPLAVVTSLMLFMIAHYYGTALLHPNAVLFTATGDGIENYFAYAWHVQHDTHPIWYRGSEYPYGELVYYTDGHPALSWALQLFHFLSPWKIGILNLLMLLAPVFCAWCLYGLFRLYRMGRWSAVAGAFAIAALQPQMSRLTGHLSLSHAWAFPLAWYLLERGRHSARPVLWACLSMLTTTLVGFTHVYLAFMIVLFQGAYWFLWGMAGAGKDPHRWRTLACAALQTLPPLIIVRVAMGVSDPLTDRPQDPITDADYMASFASVFLPSRPPFRDVFRQVFEFGDLPYEGVSYIGLVTLLMLVIAPLASLWDRFSGRAEEDHRLPPDDLSRCLFASIPLLLLAMGYWSSWFPSLTEHLDVLRQFRAPGRFAWVFYYATCVFACVGLYRMLFLRHRFRSAWIPHALFLLAMVVYVWEAHAHHVETGGRIPAGPNVFREDLLSSDERALLEAVRRSGAQTLMPLPWPHSGSEHYSSKGSEASVYLGCILSYHAGMPMMAGLSSRASLSRTRAAFAVLAPTDLPKAFAEDVPADAVFLLLNTREEITDDERDLLERSHPVFANDLAELRVIPAAELFHCTGPEHLTWYQTHREELPACDAARLSPTGTPCSSVLMAYDHSALTSSNDRYTTVWSFAPQSWPRDRPLEVSFLFTTADPMGLNISLIWERSSPAGGDLLWENVRDMRSMTVQLGDTAAIARVPVTVTDPSKVYKVVLKGRDADTIPFAVEHLLVRPLDAEVWRADAAGIVHRNNIPLNDPTDRAAGP